MKKLLFFIALSFVSNLAIAEQVKAGIGTFVLTNKTNKKITVGVGNYFPTSYTVDPGGYRVVTVSTNNQSIQIEKVE